MSPRKPYPRVKAHVGDGGDGQAMDEGLGDEAAYDERTAGGESLNIDRPEA